MTDKKTSDNSDQSSSSEQKPITIITEKPSSDSTPDLSAIKKVSQSVNSNTDKNNPKVELTGNKAQPTSKRHMKPENTTKISKTALLSLITAFIALVGIGGVHYWHTQQQSLLENRILLQTQQSDIKAQQIKQLLTEQESNITQQLNNITTKILRDNQEKIVTLENKIANLSQNQPKDWLIHEAEYLVRIAARTLWLEKDATAAIGLLKDADNRIQELNDPTFLPIRQLIHQDIEALQLIPTLNTEKVVLTLMGMSEQIMSLPLALVNTKDNKDNKEDAKSFELSESTDDWRSNLAKTWQKFSANFITISRRTANVEPLMSPQYQQNLRENLMLKLQLAQWAAAQQHASLYTKTLDDVNSWIRQYFDMDNVANLQFIEGISTLKKELIEFEYPNRLISLSAIRNLLENEPRQETLEEKEKPSINKLKTDEIKLPVENKTSAKNDDSGDA